MNEQFSLRTVRKKIMLISKTAGIALMVSYLISIRLPLEEEVSFLLWVIFVVLLIIIIDYLLILRILKTGISLEAMPPWVSENGFSSFQAVC